MISFVCVIIRETLFREIIMNQSYFDNGDSVIVADEKGKMNATIR